MGQGLSAVRETVKAADEATTIKAKQELDVLAKAIDLQLNEFESAINNKFLNPSSMQKTEIPGTRVIRKVRVANVLTKDGPAQSVGDAVDAFLGVESSGDDAAVVRNGFKILVTDALNIFMGRTEVGQHTEQRYFIFVQRNAVVRLDVMLWRWNFAGAGFSNNVQGAIGYVVCTSIVDVAALKITEFVYLISEYAGDGEEQTTKYIDHMTKVYEAARRTKLQQARSGSREPVDDLRPEKVV